LREPERGVSLIIVLLVMMLLSAIMIGFFANVMADARSSGVDRDETQAYAVAHAGMEKLTSDLAALFGSDYSPSGAQISAVAARLPAMAGFTYTDPDGTSGYKIQFTAKVGGVNTLVSTPTTAVPVPDDPTTGTTIAAGPYQGFKGLVTHYNIMVTARSTGGAEVRMRRELQTVAVPVFQFGLYSESSLAFHSADDFNFGGRIHTNGNLYLASGSSGTLTLSDKVTAVGEVVRRYLDNGLLSTSLYPGTVNVAKGTNVYRALSATANSNKGEGSVTGDAGASQTLNEPAWTTLSVGTYNGYIRNGRTGAKRLDLPLVTAGAEPIDLIRRPPATEDTAAPLVYQQRYFSQASLRILLSDTKADITGLPTVTASDPLSLEAGGVFGTAPVAASLGTGNYKSAAGTSLLGGYIKIEKQDSAGTWSDVTAEILGLGIAGRNLSNGSWNTVFSGSNGQNGTANGCLGSEPQPNAVIRLERVKDVPSTHSGATAVAFKYDCAVTAIGGTMSPTATDYWPLALYDTREGLRRDESSVSNLYPAGVMFYVELDTANLARWFQGTIGATGAAARNDNGGYVVYFSDRRNNRNASDTTATADGRRRPDGTLTYGGSAETGEFGYEDIINFTTAGGADDGVNNTTSRGEKPEDVNTDAVLETYGKMPNDGKGAYNSVATIGAIAPFDATLRPTTAFDTSDNSRQQLRGNRPLLFRRALKLTSGAALRTSGLTGLTIASENPLYVQGNYNSTAANTPTETHIAASIVADAITALSNAWNDITSFTNGTDHTNMTASSTGYRFAAVMGKNVSFLQPTNWSPETNFGMDGGAHNLLRQQENWGSATLYYRGSIVSFYISRQATGIFKCCGYVYAPPSNRIYNFDTDFLLPTGLPPGTPMFRDVNTLTFRQLLRPNQ
jgi:hypothetical protein